ALLETGAVLDTVDSPGLVDALAKRVQHPFPVLIQVNAGEEPQKSGCRPSEVGALVDHVRGTPMLALQGLLGVAPQGAPEASRPYFRLLRELAQAFDLAQVSMGMTDDFEVAVEEGATMVRVGSGIFGPRAPV